MVKSEKYYKIIDGLKYDKQLLETTDKLVNNKGDGRISVDDSKELMKKIKDRNTITKIEYRTIFYILKNYKFTDAAVNEFLKNLIHF